MWQQFESVDVLSSSSSSCTHEPTLNALALQMSLLGVQQQQDVAVRRGSGDSDSGHSSVDSHPHHLSLPTHVGAWYFEVAGAGSATDLPPSPPNGFMGDQNGQTIAVTDTVIVPSSEHVAEIVGRQGCKIKALRAKTNTYIKTPVRGDEPMFVITGKEEDVANAKREVELAADHFTQIRASRRHSQGGQPAPGHMTAYVRVPFRVVGLVVGPKGGTIKRIQQDTHTYIITPGRDREPLFEVTGLPENVHAARVLIEEHISQRTGVRPTTDCGDNALTALQQRRMDDDILQSAAATTTYGAHYDTRSAQQLYDVYDTQQRYAQWSTNDVFNPYIRRNTVHGCSSDEGLGASPPHTAAHEWPPANDWSHLLMSCILSDLENDATAK